MFAAFEKLAQKNLDHYNEHPTMHLVIPTLVAGVGLYAIGYFVRKSAEAAPPRYPFN